MLVKFLKYVFHKNSDQIWQIAPYFQKAYLYSHCSAER